MKRIWRLEMFVIVAAVLWAGCSAPGKIKVVRQTLSPPLETNCYLVFDETCGEAALIDVGGTIDSLTSVIRSDNLKLKYIFITHCHQDHVYGLPAVRRLFPEAKLCVSEADYEDAKLYSRWEEKMSPEEIVEIKKSPEIAQIMSFDVSSVITPDIYVQDDQRFKIGNGEIRAISTPGHSRGGMSYAVGNVLFSGDVLFKGTVGRTDLEGMSWESLVGSVKRLYTTLPDETIVYPGHGEPTTIGAEKRESKKIPLVRTLAP
jgi:glyoxylase-like metal-dependent hydrolase (beta-lactamase superfamily II)